MCLCYYLGFVSFFFSRFSSNEKLVSWISSLKLQQCILHFKELKWKLRYHIWHHKKSFYFGISVNDDYLLGKNKTNQTKNPQNNTHTQNQTHQQQTCTIFNKEGNPEVVFVLQSELGKVSCIKCKVSLLKFPQILI